MMNDLAKSESENQTAFDQYLDAKGLNCPLPILKSKLLLNKMQAGEISVRGGNGPTFSSRFRGILCTHRS